MKTVYFFTALFCAFWASPMLYAQSSNYLYGMTTNGGIHGAGVLFEFDPGKNVTTKKYDFDYETGAEPWGTLTAKDGKYYGMTESGGKYDMGVIFQWDPGTNEFLKRIDFAPLMGSHPLSSLIRYKEKLYGMTRKGGKDGYGVIFEWDPVSNNYLTKYDFCLVTGAGPTGDLLEFGGKFYGMTNKGGSANNGVIFEWDPETNLYTKKIDFGGLGKGSYPFGALLVTEGKLYGTTQQGGDFNAGVLFEWDPAAETYTNKWHFDSTVNGFPQGGLSADNNVLYGMAGGGSSNQGIIFQYNLATNVFQEKIEFDGVNGAEPMFNMLTKKAVIAILPFSSIYITGRRLTNKQALVTWTTESTGNIQMFQIERSIAGKKFLNIADVSAAQNSNYSSTYQFKDLSINSTALHYRVKQIDKDGTFKYSSIVRVAAEKKDPIVKLYPNPLKQSAHLLIEAGEPQEVQWNIVDYAGKILRKGRSESSIGRTEISIDVSQLVPGKYNLSVTGEVFKTNFPFIKL